MLAILGLMCLAALSANAEQTYQVMDAQVEPVTGGKCKCVSKMNVALEAVNFLFKGLLRDLTFDVDFCDHVTISELGNFTSTLECSANEDGTIQDYDIHLTFDRPTADLKCCLPTSPENAAKTVNEAFKPTGKCGANEDIGNKLDRKNLMCGDKEGEGQNEECKPVHVTADLSKLKLNIIIRMDSNVKSCYPLSFSFITKEANPTTLDDNPPFEDAWKCLTNEKNRPELFGHVFISAFKQIFKCMDENKEHPINLIEPILLMAGTC